MAPQRSQSPAQHPEDIISICPLCHNENRMMPLTVRSDICSSFNQNSKNLINDKNAKNLIDDRDGAEGLQFPSGDRFLLPPTSPQACPQASAEKGLVPGFRELGAAPIAGSSLEEEGGVPPQVVGALSQLRSVSSLGQVGRRPAWGLPAGVVPSAGRGAGTVSLCLCPEPRALFLSVGLVPAVPAQSHGEG